MQPAASEQPVRRGRRIALALLVLLAALLVLGLLWMRAASSPPEFHGTAFDPPEPAAGFTLTDHTGEQRSLSDFAGKPIFLFFGFTHCPDVCPLTLARLSEALREQGVAQGEAHVLLITVDPARDTPEVLASYVAPFGGHVTGLTGSPDRLAEIYRAYGVHAGGHDGSAIMHTTAVFGIDRAGLLRAIIRADGSREQLHEDVETLVGI